MTPDQRKLEEKLQKYTRDKLFKGEKDSSLERALCEALGLEEELPANDEEKDEWI